jgi:pyruvate,water dikinase
MRLHEQLRVWLGRGLSMLRKILLDADRRLQRQNPELPQGATWHLNLNEIGDALLGGQAKLLPLVQLRQAKRQAQLAELPPPRHASGLYGVPPEWPTLNRRLAGCFTGTGSASGQVVHIEALRQRKTPLSKQEILVCRSVNASSALLLCHAGGLIAERGSPLSHVAMVAREFGIPTVLGVGTSLRLLQNGERVFVDGDRGCVERAP